MAENLQKQAAKIQGPIGWIESLRDPKTVPGQGKSPRGQFILWGRSPKNPFVGTPAHVWAAQVLVGVGAKDRKSLGPEHCEIQALLEVPQARRDMPSIH